MSDLISREALLKVMKKSTYVTSRYFDIEGRHIGNADVREWIERYRVFDVINGAPAVDAEPVRHGKWVYHDDDMMPYKSCSLCGCEAFDLHGANYCPYCGAKMDMEREDK